MQKRVRVEKLSLSGHGIAYDEGVLYSILGVFPGDEVLIEEYKEREGVRYGKILSILTLSPMRIHTPERAPFYDTNAPWRYLHPDEENRVKEQLFRELYKNYPYDGKIHYHARDEIGYRNKIAQLFIDTKEGIDFAMYTRGDGETRKVVQKENILAHPLLEKSAKQFRQFFRQQKISANEIKYLILRYSFLENRVVALALFPQTSRKKLPIKRTEWERFFTQHKTTVKGIVVAHSPAGIRSTFSPKTFFSIGETNIQEQMLDKVYTFSPSLFFQINPRGFSEILQDVRSFITEHIPHHTSLPLLDLFAGVGLIGIALGDLVSEVISVERSPLSSHYAQENAQQNNIHTFSAYEREVAEALTLIQSEQILVLDPPRRGLRKETRERIRDVRPRYVIYISCNPETQERDIREFYEHYHIHFLKAYNLFSKTPHTESLVILERKE